MPLTVVKQTFTIYFIGNEPSIAKYPVTAYIMICSSININLDDNVSMKSVIIFYFKKTIIDR